mmetsp:Transcript_50948/g.84551  ORF Transcript_50948/g.84551 Transcript_50948/m.84551 type:complete len:87 (-) Transcript_50948:320-580(-)
MKYSSFDNRPIPVVAMHQDSWANCTVMKKGCTVIVAVVAIESVCTWSDTCIYPNLNDSSAMNASHYPNMYIISGEGGIELGPCTKG